MKSIFIFIDDITRSGGTERVAAFLANHLAAAGKRVTLVSRTAERGEPYYPLNSNVVYQVVGSASLGALARFLRAHPCDVMISISMGRLSFTLALLHTLLRLRARLVLSEHVAYETSPWWIRALKWLSYQRADDLVLLTQHDYQLLHHRVRAHTRVIRNASAFPCCAPSVCDNKAKIVLAVGRITYQKAFERLIRIWASIEQPDGWSLRIVGDGEERDSLQQLIGELGVADRVTLAPASKSISSEYARASILAMTSRYEGLPLVLIESKSFGLPVVAYDCKTGPREVIEHGVDGFLVPEGAEVMYRDRLVSLMRDADLRRKMQMAALQHSCHYAPETIIQQWLEFV